MRFHELLHRVEWSEVAEALQRHYPEDTEKFREDFRMVLKRLLVTKPETSDCCLVADPLEDEDHDEEDLPAGEAPAHVYCLQPDDLARYGIGFTSWAEVLGMEVQPQSRYQDAEMAVHVLWEMTWHGFEEQQVQDKMQMIQDRVTELQNQTPEERAEQQRRSDEFMAKYFPPKDA